MLQWLQEAERGFPSSLEGSSSAEGGMCIHTLIPPLDVALFTSLLLPSFPPQVLQSPEQPQRGNSSLAEAGKVQAAKDFIYYYKHGLRLHMILTNKSRKNYGNKLASLHVGQDQTFSDLLNHTKYSSPLTPIMGMGRQFTL